MNKLLILFIFMANIANAKEETIHNYIKEEKIVDSVKSFNKEVIGEYITDAYICAENVNILAFEFKDKKTESIKKQAMIFYNLTKLLNSYPHNLKNFKQTAKGQIDSFKEYIKANSLNKDAINEILDVEINQCMQLYKDVESTLKEYEQSKK